MKFYTKYKVKFSRTELGLFENSPEKGKRIDKKNLAGFYTRPSSPNYRNSFKLSRLDTEYKPDFNQSTEKKNNESVDNVNFEKPFIKKPNSERNSFLLRESRNRPPSGPVNLFYVEDAKVEGEKSLAKENDNIFLTHSLSPKESTIEEQPTDSKSVPKRKKIILNLRLPKKKLSALKTIRAMIQTRDPTTNAIVTREKKFNMNFDKECVSMNKKSKGRNRTYLFRSVMPGLNKISRNEKSTDLTSNLHSNKIKESSNLKYSFHFSNFKDKQASMGKIILH